ncbi:hypothetical protein EMIT0P265_10755 [Pseudomonas zeae]
MRQLRHFTRLSSRLADSCLPLWPQARCPSTLKWITITVSFATCISYDNSRTATVRHLGAGQKNTHMRAGEGVTLQRSDFTVVAQMQSSREKLEK